MYRPAGTARWEEEPVHEDTRAVIVRIKGQQAVPFILLLTGTVAGTAGGGGFAEKEILLRFQCFYFFTGDIFNDK